MDILWRIQLFGTLKAQQGRYSIHRFPTLKTGLLLAYLACYPQRVHPREELIEMLWPEVETETGRNRFKQALASLRRQIQSSGTSANSLLYTDRLKVRLLPQAFTTDVAEFQAALQESAQATTASVKRALLSHAITLYSGDLLPGYYEDWVLLERRRLSDAYSGALQQLVVLCREAEEWDQAVDYAHRVIAVDFWQEEAHADLIRLYLAMGRPGEALAQYQTLERVFLEEMGEPPSLPLRALAEQLRQDPRALMPAHPTPPAQPPVPDEPAESRPSDPLLQASRPYDRLPTPLTRFFGRDEEIASLEEQFGIKGLGIGYSGIQEDPSQPSIENRKSKIENPLTPSRLVTLTGTGGTGKTRLALELSRRLVDRFPGGVWFVPLADLTQARQIPEAIVDALGLPRSPIQEPLEQIVAFFQGGSAGMPGEDRFALLVLDNYEHLVEEGALIVHTLLAQIPSLLCLVTSRQPLDLEGEREVALLPLPLPPASAVPKRLMDYPSVQLFVDRAQARKVDFAVSPRNAGTIATLCSRLEGLPLALELAAGWSRTLAPTQMLERLEQGLDLLVSQRKDTHPRHLSLTAAIEWSFRLLSPELQRFFVRLCVFRGGWTTEAAEAVCEAPQAWRALEQLRDCSLVLTEEQEEGRMRFRMLETIRQYGRQRLLASSEAESLFRRHRDHFLALAVKNNQADQHQRAEVIREYDNLRAALEWCLSHGSEVEVTLRLMQELSLFWGGYGFWDEGRAYIARLLSTPRVTLSQEQRATTLQMGASLAIRQGDLPAARTACDEALAIWEALGQRLKMAWVFNLLAAISKHEGDYQKAYTLYQSCLTIYRETAGCAPFIAGSLHNLGCLVQAQGDYEAAWEFQQQSLKLYRELGLSGGIGICLGFLGEIACIREDYLTARPLLEESLALFRRAGEKPRIAEMLVRLAAVVVGQEEWMTAQTLLEEGLTILEELGDRPNIVLALELMAVLAMADRQYERAARLYGATHALRETLHMPLTVSERSGYDRDLARLKEALGERAFAAVFAAGSRLSWQEALQFAQNKNIDSR